MIFRGVLIPETISMALTGMSSVSASSAITAAFALPLSAGAVTRIFRLSPSHPEIPLRDDPGTTLSESFIPEKYQSHRHVFIQDPGKESNRW